MPNRIIYESARTSESLAALSRDAECLFWRLTTVADDYGRFNANITALIAACFPLQMRDITDKRGEAMLAELIGQDLVRLYQSGGHRYGYFANWSKYQQTRAKRSKFPDPPAGDDIRQQAQASASRCDQMQSNVLGIRDPGSEIRDPGSESDLAPTELVQTKGSDPARPPPLGPDDLAEAWNEHCAPSGLARVEKLSATRRKKALLRLHEQREVQFWEQVFGNIRASPFLLGLRNGRGHPKWRVSFDWLIENDTNCVKVYEGRYGDGQDRSG